MVGLPRYPSDLTDAPWALLEPLRPPSSKEVGGSSIVAATLDATYYVDRTGSAWRALPVDFPPWQTVDGAVARWQATGVTTGLPDGLPDRLPAAEAHPTDPTAKVINS